jgi:hypothetical protein
VLLDDQGRFNEQGDDEDLQGQHAESNAHLHITRAPMATTSPTTTTLMAIKR